MLDECLKCGSCRDSCPVEKAGYRSFASFPLDGLETAAVWQCANCWKCSEACPQKIDLWSLKCGLQRKPKAPDAVQNGIGNIGRYGFSLPMAEEINELRRFLGLDQIVLPGRKILDFLLGEG
jgi:heterodisulfide reductase subunit C